MIDTKERYKEQGWRGLTQPWSMAQGCCHGITGPRELPACPPSQSSRSTECSRSLGSLHSADEETGCSEDSDQARPRLIHCMSFHCFWLATIKLSLPQGHWDSPPRVSPYSSENLEPTGTGGATPALPPARGGRAVGWVFPHTHSSHLGLGPCTLPHPACSLAPVPWGLLTDTRP